MPFIRYAEKRLFYSLFFCSIYLVQVSSIPFAAVKITSQPTAAVTDGTATFSFTATGDVRTYQWERMKPTGWVNANSSSYEGFNTTTMSTTVTGTFRCRITDLAGNVTYTSQVTFTK